MPKALVHFPSISIEMHREEIETRSIHPDMVPDEKWRFIDKQGHGHFWEGKDLPTLEWVVTGQEYVGDEYDGEMIDVGEYRCKLCAEVIDPKRRVSTEPPPMGPPMFTVTIEGESFYLTGEQYSEAVELWAGLLRDRS